ncbi:MAG: hypothetical protein C4289_08825 [Chloroflexota bacterium]
MEVFLRANAGDVTFERLDHQLRERMLGNGELFFTVELSAFVSYVPDATAFAKVSIPVQVLAGAESRGVYYHEAARWIAGHLGVSFREIPGAHAPYLTQPEEFVAALRPLLRQMTLMAA